MNQEDLQHVSLFAFSIPSIVGLSGIANNMKCNMTLRWVSAPYDQCRELIKKSKEGEEKTIITIWAFSVFDMCTGTVRQRDNFEADISNMILFQIFTSKTGNSWVVTYISTRGSTLKCPRKDRNVKPLTS